MRHITARIVHETAISGLCADCGAQVAGQLALVFLIIDGTKGVAVGVKDGEEFHCIGRVPLAVIPTVPVEG